MLPFAIAACLGWILTTCLLVYSLLKAGERQRESGTAHIRELVELGKAHREEVATLSQARTEEVANLCQRIQAPEQAVISHVADSAPPDPPPLDLEDDLAMFNERERRMRELAEELAAEH